MLGHLSHAPQSILNQHHNATLSTFLRLVLGTLYSDSVGTISLSRSTWGHVFVKGGQGAGKSSIPLTPGDIFRRLHSSRLFHVEVDHHPTSYLAILQCLTCFVEFGDP